MASIRRPLTAALGVAALTTALLSGCSLVGPNGKVEACASLKTPMEKASSELSSALGDVTNDPQGAVDALNGVQDDLQKATDKLKNDDVKKASQKAVDSIGELSDAVQGHIDDPTNTDTTALSDAGTSAQESFTALAKTCTSA